MVGGGITFAMGDLTWIASSKCFAQSVRKRKGKIRCQIYVDRTNQILIHRIRPRLLLFYLKFVEKKKSSLNTFRIQIETNRIRLNKLMAKIVFLFG